MLKTLIVTIILSISFIGCSSKKENIYNKIKENEINRLKSFVVDDTIIIDLLYNNAYHFSKNILNYNDSKDFCKNLDLNNIKTWRLTQYNELGNLLNISSPNFKIYSTFNNYINVDGFYWSTRNSKLKNDMKIGIAFGDGKVESLNILGKNNFACVSKIKLSIKNKKDLKATDKVLKNEFK